MEPAYLRPDLYVVARMLEALWRNGNRLKPTHLQAAAGLNYTRFERYLAFLESRGLIQRTSESETWVELTPRGHDALRFLAASLNDILGVSLAARPSRRSP